MIDKWTETEVGDGIIKFFTDGEFVGSAMKCGKQWLWTYAIGQTFGFTSTRTEASKRVMRVCGVSAPREEWPESYEPPVGSSADERDAMLAERTRQ